LYIAINVAKKEIQELSQPLCREGIINEQYNVETISEKGIYDPAFFFQCYEFVVINLSLTRLVNNVETRSL